MNVIVYAFITEYQHIDILYPEIIPIWGYEGHKKREWRYIIVYDGLIPSQSS